MAERRAARRRWGWWTCAAALILLLALGPGQSLLVPVPAPLPPSTALPRVVLITFDGVRWQEIFHGPDPALRKDGEAEGALIPFLLAPSAQSGVLIGDRRKGSRMRLDNPFGVSVPGYQALLVGRPTLCATNLCGPPTTETLPERIRRRLGLPRKSVAVFTTYPGICDAMASQPDAIFLHCGTEVLDAPPETSHASTKPESGRDHRTFVRALHYLETKRPRFLYIALNDTDSMGHAGDYEGYLDVMRHYDLWLRELDRVLLRMGTEGEATNIVITTDHGRGRGEEWGLHRLTALGTHEIWLYARGPDIAARGSIVGGRTFSHADVAPTIEHLFGLEPTRGFMRGRVIEELFDERGDCGTE